jgi:hypothetical protein
LGKFNPIELHDLVGASDMTLGEVITRFKQANDRRKILEILSDETSIDQGNLREILIRAGVDYKLFPRARRKQDLPEVKPEDAERLQAERDRPKPQPPGRPKTPEPADVVELVQILVDERESLIAELGRVNDQINKVLELVSRAVKGEKDG